MKMKKKQMQHQRVDFKVNEKILHNNREQSNDIKETQ